MLALAACQEYDGGGLIACGLGRSIGTKGPIPVVSAGDLGDGEETDASRWETIDSGGEFNGEGAS